jgi:hypothetical protein
MRRIRRPARQAHAEDEQQRVIRHYHKYVPNPTRRDGVALAAVLDGSLSPATP